LIMELDRKFERYTGGPTTPNNQKLHVTLSKTGIFFFNKNLHQRWGKPLAVHIYYNRKDDQIAIVPTSPRLPLAFPIKEKNNGFIVHANPFVRHFGIRVDKTLRFVAPEVRDGNLILKLAEVVCVALTKPRRKPNTGAA
jgi:hypothetical protein